ncbi:MAG: cobalamin-dependent protein, partial [Patescibacteria group bacterium]
MGNFRVLMLYPNLRTESMVPPNLALFSAILKREGIEVALFDTTNYDIPTEFANTDRLKATNLNVRPYELRQDLKTSNPYEDFRKKIESFGANLILVTATENMFPMAINLLRYVDDIDVPIILGGVFATFAPDLVMRWKEIDILCVGEGEHAIVELCKKMARGENYSNIPNLWIREKDGSIKKNPMG